MYSESILSKNLLDTFEIVQKRLKRLCLHVHDGLSSLPLWVDDGIGGFSDNRDMALYALKHITFAPEMAAQETYSCAGAIAGTKHTINLIKAVNEAKDDFKLTIKETRKHLGSVASKFIRDLLTQKVDGVVKLKEVTRHIHYITYHPRKISWTTARDGANVVIDYNEALQRLQDFGEGEAVQIQLSKLSLLNETDKLVVHRDIRAYWIVNIAKFKTKFGTAYENIRTSLPLFYIHDNELPPPLVTIRQSEPRKKTRADKQIENTPFLNAISAYRYKNRRYSPNA